jgi:hypothetical protein
VAGIFVLLTVYFDFPRIGPMVEIVKAGKRRQSSSAPFRHGNHSGALLDAAAETRTAGGSHQQVWGWVKKARSTSGRSDPAPRIAARQTRGRLINRDLDRFAMKDSIEDTDGTWSMN